MITGGSNATNAFLSASLTALLASWSRREAGRCPGRHHAASTWQPPIRVLSENTYRIRGSCVGGQGSQPPLPSTLLVSLGHARACSSTWAPTSPSRRMLANHSPAQLETSSEASGAVQSSRLTSSVYSSLLAVTSHMDRGAAIALASDVVQPTNSVQPERKTLRAEDVTLDDASSDVK